MSLSARAESVLQAALADQGVANELITALNSSIGILAASSTFTGNNTFSGNNTLSGNVSLGGAAKTVGFFGSAGALKPSAYTQTYVTADKTHAAPTATALTDNSGGTADSTIALPTAIVAASVDTSAASLATVQSMRTVLMDNLADLAAKVNALIVDVADVKQLANSVIDDLQAVNLVG